MARLTSSQLTTPIPALRPAQLANITSPPIQSRSGVMPHDGSLPSLLFGTSSSRPSIATDFTRGPPVRLQIAEQERVKSPQMAVLKINNLGPKLDDSMMGGSSHDGIIV
jgi:hypothetical protein